MVHASRVFRLGMSALGSVSPSAAAEIAYRVWRDLGTPEKVRERDAQVHAEAVKGELLVAGERVATYTWGDGPDTVLLVHGWRSRASGWGAMVTALRSAERTVVAFDAPGNGDSSGRFTTILDYADAIRQLGDRHGRFSAVVGHSFGVLAAFLAVREGVATERLVGISGMHDADQLVDALADRTGLPHRARRHLRRRIEQRTFPAVPDVWRRFVAELDPADTRTPLLLVHDADDRVVPLVQSRLIAEAHTGPVLPIVTKGLGHYRILRDPTVALAVRQFVAGTLGDVDEPVQVPSGAER